MCSSKVPSSSKQLEVFFLIMVGGGQDGGTGMCCPTVYVKQRRQRKAPAGIEPKVAAPPYQERDHMMGGAPGVLRWANMSQWTGIKSGWTTVRLCTGAPPVCVTSAPVAIISVT